MSVSGETQKRRHVVMERQNFGHLLRGVPSSSMENLSSLLFGGEVAEKE